MPRPQFRLRSLFAAVHRLFFIEPNPMMKFIQLLEPIGCGIRMVEAAEAFETPPLNGAARRYASIAVCSLLVGSLLLLAAALVDTLANARPLSEKLGFAGIGCVILCVYSGLRYKDTNTAPLPAPPPTD